jgi:hypothetical protein
MRGRGALKRDRETRDQPEGGVYKLIKLLHDFVFAPSTRPDQLYREGEGREGGASIGGRKRSGEEKR